MLAPSVTSSVKNAPHGQNGSRYMAARPAAGGTAPPGARDWLSILLAEEVAMVRGALVALIEREPDLKVVADVERGDEILPVALAHRPDVAIIDIDRPGLDGLAAASLLSERLPSCRTLILT